MLFLFYDIHRYVRDLNNVMSSVTDINNPEAEIIRDSDNMFYSVRDKEIGHKSKIYEIQTEYIKQIKEKIYSDTKPS